MFGASDIYIDSKWKKTWLVIIMSSWRNNFDGNLNLPSHLERKNANKVKTVAKKLWLKISSCNKPLKISAKTAKPLLSWSKSSRRTSSNANDLLAMDYIKELDIRLDKEYYYAGEVLSGKVMMHTTENFKLKCKYSGDVSSSRKSCNLHSNFPTGRARKVIFEPKMVEKIKDISHKIIKKNNPAPPLQLVARRKSSLTFFQLIIYCKSWRISANTYSFPLLLWGGALSCTNMFRLTAQIS